MSSSLSSFSLLYLAGNIQLWFGFYTIRPSFAPLSGKVVALGHKQPTSSNLIGNFTGNLTGNLTGDLEGDLEGL